MTTPVQPTGSNTHISSNFGKLLAPGLRKIFFETYGEVPEQFSKVYKINKSTKAKETDYGLGAFSDWEKRTTNLDTVAYDTLSPGLEREYVHSAFTKGFMIERELYDDEQYRQINKFPAAMARAGRAFVEKEAAKPFHNGVNPFAPIFDEKPLFADDHPLVDSTGTGSNVGTGALNDANLKIALQQMRETVDEAGNLITCNPKKLIVPPSLEYTAKTLMQSMGIVGSDFNDANVVKGALDVVVYDYIGETAGGSDVAWYLMDPSIAELNFFWRIKPEFKWDEDFDTFVAKYRGYMRFSYGVSDWRGIYCSKGATASAAPVVAKTVTDATSTVITAVVGAKLQVYINGVLGATTVASATSEEVTIPKVKTGDEIDVIQTEPSKYPTVATQYTVVAS